MVRVDVMWLMIKDDRFRDNPLNPDFKAGGLESHKLLPLYTANQPEVLQIVEDMRRVMDEFSDRVLIGEIYLPVQQLVAYYGKDLKGAQLPFNFQLLQCPWNAASLAQTISAYEAALPPGAWPNWVLGNHENSRIATRVGAAQSAAAALLLLTLPGTLTLYYGEELGLADVPIAGDQVQYPAEKNEPGIGAGGARHSGKSSCVLREGTKVRYAFIQENKHLWPIRLQCRVLGVSASGYHQHLARRRIIDQRRHLSDEVLLVHVRTIYAETRGAYGWPRIWRQMRARGVRVGKRRVQRLMKKHGIRARGRRRLRVMTTDSRHNLPVAPNVLDRKFNVAAPNQVWAGDFTYVATEQGLS